MKNNQGITLIALVITIIILLILTSITIKYTIGYDGIIARAQQAKEIYEQSAKNETEAINNIWIEANKKIEEPLLPKDEELPIANITINAETTQITLPITLSATVRQEDSGSGINIEFCKYIINTESKEIGLEEENYTGGVFTSEEETLTLELSSVADWYLHVLTIDRADNRTETIKKITVKENHHSHIGNSSSNGGCYTKAVYHKHTDACRVNVYCNDGPYEGETNGQYRTFFYGKCSHCGNKVSRNWSAGYSRCGSCTICGKTTSSIQSYSLTCGKTTDTVEGYTVIYEN